MSLGQRMMTVVLLLCATVAGLLVRDGVTHWTRFAQAVAGQDLNRVSMALDAAAASRARERGLAIQLLGNPAKAATAARDAAIAARKSAEASLGIALAALPAPASAPLEAPRSAADKLRARLDTALQTGQGGPAQSEWFAAVTAEIDAIIALRRRIDAQGQAEDSLARLVALRDRLGEMAEFAGRERGLLAGIIATDARPTPAQLLTIGAGAGRIDAAWASIVARRTDLPAALSTALDAAQVAWFTDFAPVRARIVGAALSGAPWPLRSGDWFAASSHAIDALLAAQSVAGAGAGAAFDDQASGATTTLIIQGGVLCAAILLGALLAWYLRHRVTAPLHRAIEVISRLAGGDLAGEIPASTDRGEIGRLLRATVHFRDTARQNEAMLATQEKLRREAETARTDAINELGGMIENITAQALEKVRGMVVDLRASAEQIESRAHTIAGGCVETETDARQGQGSADNASSGARELTGAIREIAEQMERAAASTRLTVERTEESRDVFDALSASVAEIGDVARLIGEIAERTNLLALNATIEAARAGDAGRGFAVVAGEVKALAQETARSTDRITQRIGSIETATRKAVTMMAGIASEISNLNSISASVAAAIEEQTSATAAIAGAVENSNDAAARVAGRMGSVAQDTEACAEAASTLTTIGREVEAGVSALTSDIVRLMRTRVAELERRQTPRFRVDITASVRAAALLSGPAQEISGTIGDISEGGARFIAELECSVPVGSTLRLTATGLPPLNVRVAGGGGKILNLAFAFASDVERDLLRSAVSALARRLAA